MSKRDLKRLDTYSRRVRVLQYSSAAHSTLNPRTHLLLSQLRPSPLFPALRSLHCSAMLHSDDGALPAVGPTLRAVDIGYAVAEDGSTEPFLVTLAAKATSLTRLSLHTGFGTPALVYLSHFAALRVLDVSGIGKLSNRQVQLYIGGLQSLEELTVTLTSKRSELSQSPNTDGSPQFGALRRLLVIGDLFQIVSLLDQMTTKHMELLRVSATVGSVENYIWSTFLMCISTKWACSLRSLSVTSPAGHLPQPPPLPLPALPWTHPIGDPLTTLLPVPSTWRSITVIHLPPPGASGSGFRFSIDCGAAFLRGLLSAAAFPQCGSLDDRSSPRRGTGSIIQPAQHEWSRYANAFRLPGAAGRYTACGQTPG